MVAFAILGKCWERVEVDTLAIVEPHCAGHRLQYVRWIAREALAQGHDVQLITLTYCLKHPLYLVMQRECGGRIRTSILPDNGGLQSEKWLERQTTAGLVRREFAYHSLFSRYFRKLSVSERPDLVFVPYLDYCTNAVGLLGSPFGDIPWGGIVMRSAFHFESVGVQAPASRLHPIKKRLFFSALGDRYLRRMFTIDETLVEYVDRNKPELSNKLRFAPDPVHFEGSQTREEARRKLSIPEDAVVLLVYGALSLRKGIDMLLNAAQQSGFPKEVLILLAGRQNKEVKNLLSSPQAQILRQEGQLREYDRFLSGEEEYMVFRAADIVWLGYRGHYTTSAVLVQAGMMGIPVISCDTGLIGWLTHKHKLGSIVSVDDARQVASAIAELMQSLKDSNEYGQNGKCFSARHRLESFTQRVISGIGLS